MVEFTVLADILWIIVWLSWLILIIAGLFTALWIFQRLAEAYDDNETLPNLVKFIGFFGVFIGIICFITAVGGFLIPYFTETPTYTRMSMSTLIALVGAGIILCIRPIKNVRWGALLSLGVGILSMVVIIALKMFIFPHVNDTWLIILIVILFAALGGFYFTIKIFEDLYVLIGNILDSPPVALAAGIICIIEGILVFFETSIFDILMLLLGQPT
ncbi:MAG: hypothetical protein ACXAEU_02175 [Candidatus Hodarchaeales archaeon]|jgi:hypothetical protein